MTLSVSAALTSGTSKAGLEFRVLGRPTGAASWSTLGVFNVPILSGVANYYTTHVSVGFMPSFLYHQIDEVIVEQRLSTLAAAFPNTNVTIDYVVLEMRQENKGFAL